MNYNDILIKYIDEYPYDEPIFIEDIKDYFKNYIKNNFQNIRKYENVIEKRLCDDCTLDDVLEGNKQVRLICEEYNLDYILIDKEYEINVDL